VVVLIEYHPRMLSAEQRQREDASFGVTHPSIAEHGAVSD
jgi:hypothetical protein